MRASANQLVCLDRRLEDDKLFKTIVFGVLVTLKAWTTRCIELAEVAESITRSSDHQKESNPASANDRTNDPLDGITLEEAKSNIERLLTLLCDLELPIWRASTASRMSRADGSFNKRKHDYDSLFRELKSTLRVWGAIRRKQSSVDQRVAPADSNEIDVKSALDYLQREEAPLRPEQEILVLSNVKRAHRFKFFRQWEGRSDRERVIVKPLDDAVTTIALRANYPPPPEGKTRCPYCFIPFKGEADDDNQWK